MLVDVVSLVCPYIFVPNILSCTTVFGVSSSLKMQPNHKQPLFLMRCIPLTMRCILCSDIYFNYLSICQCSNKANFCYVSTTPQPQFHAILQCAEIHSGIIVLLMDSLFNYFIAVLVRSSNSFWMAQRIDMQSHRKNIFNLLSLYSSKFFEIFFCLQLCPLVC